MAAICGRLPLRNTGKQPISFQISRITLASYGCGCSNGVGTRYPTQVRISQTNHCARVLLFTLARATVVHVRSSRLVLLKTSLVVGMIVFDFGGDDNGSCGDSDGSCGSVAPSWLIKMAFLDVVPAFGRVQEMASGLSGKSSSSPAPWFSVTVKRKVSSN